MKNKKLEQLAAKKRYRDRLKAQRRTTPDLDRPPAILIKKPSILIVCEGKNTEPSYFNQFRLSSVSVKAIGEGFNTISLVKRAKQLSREGDYEQVWCVFDKDDFKESDFNTAIQRAENLNFKVAYSNQSFEYWLILHLSDHQGGKIHRNDYNSTINKLLKPFKVEYGGKKSKIIEDVFFEILDGIDKKTKTKRVELAIKRAKRNYDQFEHTSPAKEESSTTVFRLVLELLKYI